MSKITNNSLAALALAGLAAVASGPAFAGGMTVDTKGGLEVFELDENNYWFKISGRMFFDQVWYDTDNDNDNNNFSDTTSFPSGGHIRSARVTFKGGVGHNWVYKVDMDYADNPGVIYAKFGEAFVGYSGCKNFWLAFGQISVPFGLENWASSSDTTFMEISLPSQAFAPDKGLGVYAEWHGHMLTAAAAVYHEAAGYIATGDVISSPARVGAAPLAGTGPLSSDPGSDDLGFAARVTFSPVHDDYTVYHLGVSSRWEKLHQHANNFDYYTTGLEASSRQAPFLFTNIPPNSVKHHNVWGFELAGRWGPFLVQGEYMVADVTRDDSFPPFDERNPGGDLDYYGYYVAASYVLTGEAREYDFDSGTFGTVHPASRKGAWELGLRHSYVNLIDNQGLLGVGPFPTIDFVPAGAVDFAGNAAPNAGNNFGAGNGLIGQKSIVGSAHSTTVGLTWYVNDNVRFMANYIRLDVPNESDVDTLGLRAQVVW